MEVPLPALLLLLVARALASNNDGSCLAANIEVQEMPKIIQKFKGPFNSITLYVMPEPGFRGVILETTVGIELYNASFAISEECYDDSGLRWNELRVRVWPSQYHPAGFEFEVRIGECGVHCLWDGLTDASNLAVVSDGNSRWRYSSKLGCDINHMTKVDRYRQGLCSDPSYNGKKTTTTTTTTTDRSSDTSSTKRQLFSTPATTTPTIPTRTHDKTTIIVLSVVVVVVVVVLVLVWWKRRFVKLPNVMRFLSQPAAASQPLQLTAGQGHAPGQDEGRRVVVPQPAAPCRPPQPTAGQGHAPDQDEEHIYYELLADGSERRVVVPQPAQHAEQPVYHDVLPPASPVYANVHAPGGGGAPPPAHPLLAAGQRESELYATVL